MGKKLHSFLFALAAALGLVILVLSSQGTTTKAATNYVTDDLLSGMSIQQKDYGTGSNINLTLDWKANGNTLQNGDTWTVTLPDTLKVTDTTNAFDVVNDNGDPIGKAELGIDANGDSYVKITFTDIENQTNHEGSLNLVTGIGVGKDAIIGDNDVQIGHLHDNMHIVNSDDDFSKKGVISKDAEGNSIITWSVLVNRNSANFENLEVHETINSDQSYLPGTLKVYEANWIEDKPGFYEYKKGETSNFIVDPEQSSISDEFTVSGLKPDQFYVVQFQTMIIDQEKATNGYKFKNNATFNWGANGSGNTSTNNEDNASGSVSGGTNSGNGNGTDIKGGVVLTKEDSKTSSTLAGAVYSLYKEDGTLVQSDLTTDENGQISVDALEKGNYYFKEDKAPEGYESSKEQIIPFTIKGEHSEIVSVLTKDQPKTDIVEDQEGSIVLMKMDDETDYRLAGAEYSVTDSSGNFVGTITTDSMGIGHMYNLKPDTYTIKETKAPAGYLLSDQTYQVTISKDDLNPALITFKNAKDDDLIFDDSYPVKLQKFDRDDMKTGVPGAEYTLYTADGTKVETKTTDENGMISIDGLKPGDYYFQETKAPDGFDINSDKLYFTIVSGTNTVQTVETSDPRTEGGNTTDPDVDGNGGNEGTDPDVDGNGNTTDPDDNNGGLITNPGNNNNSNNSNNTLPQTGAKSGMAVSLIGLVVLLGTVYFKRRHA